MNIQKLKALKERLYEDEIKRDEIDRDYLGMSSIGDRCERKLWYGFRKFNKINIGDKTDQLFKLGHLIEWGMIDLFEKKGISIQAKQLEVSDFGNKFKGHIDGLICNGSIANGKKILFECKSSNQANFNSIVKKGFSQFNYYHKYNAQAQCYMGYLDLTGCLFVIYNKNNSDIHLEFLEFDKDEFNILQDKAQRIILSKNPPERFYKKKLKECDWCEHKIICRYPDLYFMSEEDEKCSICKHFLYYFNVTSEYRCVGVCACTTNFHLAVQTCEDWELNI